MYSTLVRRRYLIHKENMTECQDKLYYRNILASGFAPAKYTGAAQKHVCTAPQLLSNSYKCGLLGGKR